MRILHIDSGEAMQGGQWQLLFLARALRARAFEQTLSVQGRLAELARAEGFCVAPKAGRAPDLVHVHDARSHTRAILSPGAPVIVSRRVGFPVKSGFLSRWKYRRAAHFIAVSQYVRQTLLDAGLKPERVSVVYDGVPLSDYREPAPNGPVVGVMKDPLSGLLASAARRANIELRPLASVDSDFAGAMALAYISGMQGLGSAALAAMAVGLPVIASRSAGGLPETLEHERNGLLVENKEEEIAEALARLRGDREFHLALSRNAWERARSLFSLESMANGTINVYTKVLHNSFAAPGEQPLP